MLKVGIVSKDHKSVEWIGSVKDAAEEFDVKETTILKAIHGRLRWIRGFELIGVEDEKEKK